MAGAVGGKKTPARNRLDDAVGLVCDLLWAFTRADREFDDRLVYEAFSSGLLKNNRQRQQRRQSGPMDFTRLHVDERYTMLATATLLPGPQAFRQWFYYLHFDWQGILACFHRRLKDADRGGFARRQGRWPVVSAVDGVGPDTDISVGGLSRNVSSVDLV